MKLAASWWGRSRATHTVQAGDTLSAIADQTGTAVDAWLVANPGQDGDSLTVGQVVQVPGTSP